MLYIKDNIIKDSNLITIETEDSFIYNPDHDTLLSNGWEVYKEKPNTKIIENKGFVKTTSEEFELLDKSVYENTIVFIEDTKQICSNGIYYGSSNSQNIIDITYSELTTLRDNSQLIPGMQYRIIDYVTTTVQGNTQSANHQFDIIVTADSENTLNENARAIQCEGDTYFSNSNLNAWELKYSLDNDTSRFVWTDTENGKGVIYYMKDEYGNEAPYDFKNIQFLRNTTWFNEHSNWCDSVLGIMPTTDQYYYTFTWVDENNNIEDISIIGNTLLRTDEGIINGVFNNVIKPYTKSDISTHFTFTLPDNVLVSSHNYDSGFFYGCYSNIFGDNCYSNTFGNGCYSNTFGTNCYSNTFGNDCYSNTFRNDCYSNIFSNYCTFNVFGNYCDSNIFSNYCTFNVFRNYCYSNTFGDKCKYNTFGTVCNYNTFGDYCDSNTFGNGCYYIKLITSDGEEVTNEYQYYKFTSGLHGTSKDDMLEITLTPNLEYETKVARKSNGKIVIYNESDLIADQN